MRVRFGYKLYPVGRSACEPPYSAYLVRGNTHFKNHTDCLTRVHGEGAFWRGGANKRKPVREHRVPPSHVPCLEWHVMIIWVAQPKAQPNPLST